MSQDFQTRWSHTKEDNLSGPAVRATTRTLTPATLAIPSHNSRDVILSHNSRNATCLTLSQATTQGICSDPQLKEPQQADHRDITKTL